MGIFAGIVIGFGVVWVLTKQLNPFIVATHKSTRNLVALGGFLGAVGILNLSFAGSVFGFLMAKAVVILIGMAIFWVIAKVIKLN